MTNTTIEIDRFFRRLRAIQAGAEVAIAAASVAVETAPSIQQRETARRLLRNADRVLELAWRDAQR